MHLVMVDVNEATQSPKVIERLRVYFPNLEITPLDCGDVKVILDDGSLLAIERKSAGDFLASIGDGRLFDQVERMAKSSKWSCVIIEGAIRYDADDMAVIPIYNKARTEIINEEVTGWRGASVRGAIYALLWSCCPVLATEPVNFAGQVNDLIRFCTKPSEHTQQPHSRRIVTFPPLTTTEGVLMGFPGLGIKRIRALVEFAARANENGVGTLAESLTWGAALLGIKSKSRPEGWGDKTIANFRTTLGLEPWEQFDVFVDWEVLKETNPLLFKKMKQNKERANGK